MACSGLPLLLSSAVGAAERFLISEKNGFIFESNSVRALKQALTKLFKLEPERLYRMGQKSHKLAQQITINQWMETLKIWMA
jgi:glycosyltransferase involved in cell wall biosynthesis